MQAECKQHHGFFDVKEGCAYCDPPDLYRMSDACVVRPYELRTWIDTLHKDVLFKNDILELAVKTILGEEAELNEDFDMSTGETTLVAFDKNDFDVRFVVDVPYVKNDDDDDDILATQERRVFEGRKRLLEELISYDRSQKGKKRLK